MNKKALQIKYVCIDFISAALMWFLFNYFRFHEVKVYVIFGNFSSFIFSNKVLAGSIIVPFLFLFIYYLSGYYSLPWGRSRLSELFTTLITSFIGTLIVFFLVLLNDLPESFTIYYKLCLALFFLSFFITYIPRLIITQSTTSKIQKRLWSIKVAIIGTGDKAREIATIIEKPVHAVSYSVVDYIDPDKMEDLETMIKKQQIDELVVAIDSENKEELLQILYSLYHYKIPIKLPINNAKLLTGGVRLNSITGAPLVDVTSNNFSEAEKNIKFVTDKIISFICLILLSPFYLYLAIRVKWDSPGPVIFKQKRIGYRGEPFYIYKFRTMYKSAESDQPLLSSKEDERVTPFGKTMRKYRLDELPQFWNVLKGDMSLVGPRPERKFFIDQIVKQAPWYYLLHNVRPGVTSWGMVKYGYASNLKQMIERMDYDILYYENMSLLIDVKIVIYTIRTILTGKGV